MVLFCSLTYFFELVLSAPLVRSRGMDLSGFFDSFGMDGSLKRSDSLNFFGSLRDHG